MGIDYPLVARRRQGAQRLVGEGGVVQREAVERTGSAQGARWLPAGQPAMESRLRGERESRGVGAAWRGRARESRRAGSRGRRWRNPLGGTEETQTLELQRE